MFKMPKNELILRTNISIYECDFLRTHAHKSMRKIERSETREKEAGGAHNWRKRKNKLVLMLSFGNAKWNEKNNNEKEKRYSNIIRDVFKLTISTDFSLNFRCYVQKESFSCHWSCVIQVSLSWDKDDQLYQNICVCVSGCSVLIKKKNNQIHT